MIQLNAKVKLFPVMTREDLQGGLENLNSHHRARGDAGAGRMRLRTNSVPRLVVCPPPSFTKLSCTAGLGGRQQVSETRYPHSGKR